MKQILSFLAICLMAISLSVFGGRITASAAAQYTITLDPDGGSVSTTKMTVVAGQNYRLPNPVKDGYSFKGWYNPNGDSFPSEFTCGISSDITLRARWGYGLNLYLDDGGSGAPGYTSLTFGEAFSLNTPVKSGYRFIGWYTYPTGGDLFPSTGICNIKSGFPLYAHWEPEYRITFSGTNVDSRGYLFSYVNLIYGEEYSLPLPVKTGYSFDGWFWSEGKSDQFPTKGTFGMRQNVTLYPHFTANKYVLTFDPKGGSFTSGSSKKTVTFRQEVGELPVVEKTGYQFGGWCNSGLSYNLISSHEITESDINNPTWYASWVACRYQVTYDVNGGSCNSATWDYCWYDSTISNSMNNKGFPTVTRTGYKLDGWYTAKEGGKKIGVNDTIKFTNDFTLYAHWTPNTYTLTYDPNGGSITSGQFSSKTVTYDGTYGAVPGITRTGYTYLGYFTKKEGGERIYTDTVYRIAANSTIYAHWAPKTYTVTLTDGGKKVSTVSATYDSKIGTLPSLDKLGYSLSWVDENGKTITANTVYQYAKNITLTAKWAPNNYIITFDPNGGSITSSSAKMTATFDGTYGTLPAVKRTGYKFLGWYTTKTDGTKVIPSSHVKYAADRSLYAHWEKSNYTITFDPNGGEFTSDSVRTTTVHYEETYGTLAKVKKSGYTFLGWFTEKEGGTKVVASSKVKYPGSRTLYAHFEPNDYVITFDANGGSFKSGSIRTSNVSYEGTYGTLASVQRSGYVFDGWYTAKEGGVKIVSTSVVKYPGSRTVYAHWSPKK